MLLFAHGLGSHSGRYGNIVNCLVPRGLAVYGFDQIGHGKSEGARGMVERFGDFTDTLAIYYDMVHRWQPGKSIFLFGHSAGGLIAIAHLLDHQTQYQGAILSAPALKIRQGVSPAAIVIGGFLAVIAPRTGILKLNPNRLSHDPDVVRGYLNDPLVYHARTPARLAVELGMTMRRVGKELGRITLPFLALQGGEENIVNPEGVQMLYDRARSTDKTIRIYEGMYHETFNEPGRVRVLEDMEHWLETHI